MSCPFCSPNKEEIIASNEYAYAIIDENPLIRGHVLIVTKKHYENIMEMPDNELCSMMKLAKRLEMRMVERLGVKGITIRQNWAPFIPEGRLVVRHVHLHLIPREMNDRLYYNIKRKELSEWEKSIIINKLRE